MLCDQLKIFWERRAKFFLWNHVFGDYLSLNILDRCMLQNFGENQLH